ncbi:MAG: serine racemase VanT catalytic subunit [Cellulosilyticaceae bacterium]
MDSPISGIETEKELRAYREINLQYLKHNLEQIESLLDDICEVMAVVKADAYGHGAVEVSRYLQSLGVNHFAVACLDEAIVLRKANIKGEILILGYTPISRRADLITFDISQTIVDLEYFKAVCQGEDVVKVHIKLDTGMNRMGMVCEEEELVKIYESKQIAIQGTFTHLSRADSLLEEDVAFTWGQIKKFDRVVEALKKREIEVGKTHVQSSYGIINYRNLKYDLVRPGIVLYGVSSEPNDQILKNFNFKPVLALKAKVASIKKIKQNETVGYGNHFRAEKDLKIAVVTIGYADGYPRRASNCNVLVDGQKARIVGNVCMDQMIIDVSEIGKIQAGDVVTLVGKDKKEYLLVNQLSETMQTINNQMLTGISSRVSKCYV